MPDADLTPAPFHLELPDGTIATHPEDLPPHLTDAARDALTNPPEAPTLIDLPTS